MLPVPPQPDEDLVRYGVPGVVNSYNKQHERGPADEEKRGACGVQSDVCRDRKNRVCRNRKQNMEQPVLEHRFVNALHAHAPGHDDDIGDTKETNNSPESGDNERFVPRCAHDGREHQHDSEVNDAWGCERAPGLRLPSAERLGGNEGNDDELQSDQGAGRRADDDVEVLPSLDSCHVPSTSLAPGTRLYCSSLTFSIQLTTLPSSSSWMAMCVIALFGVAPCQCFSPGGQETTSPG